VSYYFLLAALANTAAAVVHGVIGHRIIMTPLTTDRLFPTGAFGDADMSRRVLLVTWHIVTAAFACSASAMLSIALGAVNSVALPLFLSGMHAAFILVGLLAVRGKRVPLSRPIPLTFFACMGTVSLMGWLGSR
jgi:hypothetical protein